MWLLSRRGELRTRHLAGVLLRRSVNGVQYCNVMLCCCIAASVSCIANAHYSRFISCPCSTSGLDRGKRVNLLARFRASLSTMPNNASSWQATAFLTPTDQLQRPWRRGWSLVVASTGKCERGRERERERYRVFKTYTATRCANWHTYTRAPTIVATISHSSPFQGRAAAPAGRGT